MSEKWSVAGGRCVLVMLLIGGGPLNAVRGEPGGASPSKKATPPAEMGTIQWMKGFTGAVERARREKRPVLILFQEIPGCGTCTGYGRQVLSHPFVRDAAESLFVPVCVRNNSQGDEDARVLAQFKEPAWNNPVVRIISPDRKMLADRVSGDYTVAGLARAMSAALRAEKRAVPNYLDLLAFEEGARSRGVETAVFAMHCFWEGESALGGLKGVVSTKPGFVRGSEVVEVEFDPAVVRYEELLSIAMKRECASNVFTRSDSQQEKAGQLPGMKAERTDDAVRPDREPKYFLSKTPYRFVPMTETQAARLNSAMHSGGDAKAILSPGQLKLLDEIERRPEAGWRNMIGRKDLIRAWDEACAKVGASK